MALETIKQKLRHLRDTVDFNKNLEVFNDANGNADLFDVVRHRYQPSPCLTEAETIAIEQRFDIHLPDDYRTFLMEVGDGGAGPYYGLYTLTQGIEIAARKARQETADAVLKRSFPLTSPLALRDRSDKAAVEAFLAEIMKTSYVHGTLPLADFGCGIDALLVVTGEVRGTMWLDDRGSDNGVWPICIVDGKADFTIGLQHVYDGGDPAELQYLDFARWYEYWLDERIDIHERYRRGEWHSPWGEARSTSGTSRDPF
jgi:hypothetical protein